VAESPITGIEMAENDDTSLGAVGAGSSSVIEWQPRRTATTMAATGNRTRVKRIFNLHTLNRL
jgi:hypothetical protein